MKCPRNLTSLLSGVAITLLAAASNAVAAETPPNPPATAQSRLGATSPAAGAARTQRPPTPMFREIQALLEQERAAIEALGLSPAPRGAEALRLQRQVEQIKRQTQWSILEVQIRHARAEGRAEVAAQLESALTAAKAPPAPVATPTPAPAPELPKQQ